MTRQSTSKEILDVDWDYPVATTFAKKTGVHTVASEARVAWPAPAAFKKIAGDDPRPLLVMRECHACAGSEHALFSRRLDNEKTKLLLHWFHCVKLPADVQQKDHPFYNVFEFKHGFRPHLFICTADGQNKKVFTGAQPQSLLQLELNKVMKIAYQKNPKPAIQAMMNFLTKFDMYDLRETELLAQMDDAREKSGPDSSACKKIEKTLAGVRLQKAKAMKGAKAVCDLKLRVVQIPPKPSASPPNAPTPYARKSGD